MKQDSTHRQVTSAVSQGLFDGTAFFASVISGTLLGLGADYLFGTDPWFVVLGIVVGSGSGFAQMWRASAKMEEPRRRDPLIGNSGEGSDT